MVICDGTATCAVVLSGICGTWLRDKTSFLESTILQYPIIIFQNYKIGCTFLNKKHTLYAHVVDLIIFRGSVLYVS